jgi:hypothetical protein
VNLFRGTLVLALSVALTACGGGGGGGGGTSVVGVWSGDASLSTSGTVAMQVAALAEGAIAFRLMEDGDWVMSNGTYAADGDTVTGTYRGWDDGLTYAFEATVSATRLTGTIGLSPSTSGAASFSLARGTAAGSGVYLGAYHPDVEPTHTYPFLLMLFPSGELQTTDGADLVNGRARGAWGLSGDGFSADFVHEGGNVPYALEGTRDGDTLSGTMRDTAGGVMPWSGTFSVTQEH